MRPICYVCEQEVIPATGYSRSDVLIVGEEPGKHELAAGKPFVSITKYQTAGSVLRQELANLGYDLFQFKLTNLWYHKPYDKSHKNYEPCFEASKNACLEEMKGKKAILLIGSDCVSYFTDYKVSDVNGLQVDSNMISCPIIYACVQTASVFHNGVGEVRFAISNFIEHIKKEGLI